MQITHQEARHLIQFSADQSLDRQQKERLKQHLKDCAECVDYANQMQETEVILRTTLRKQWNVHYYPIQIRDVKAKDFVYHRLSNFVTTRSTFVGITLLFFFFVFWQFTLTDHSFQPPMTIGVPAIPTPSLPLTSTQNSFSDCQMIAYEVSQADSWKSIANRFSISEEVLRDLNNLQEGATILPTNLMVPLCDLTPTVTSHPPVSTPNTPALELITFTPG